jgi:hypothetical protein
MKSDAHVFHATAASLRWAYTLTIQDLNSSTVISAFATLQNLQQGTQFVDI